MPARLVCIRIRKAKIAGPVAVSMKMWPITLVAKKNDEPTQILLAP